VIQIKEQIVGRHLAYKFQEKLDNWQWDWQNRVRPALWAPWCFLKNVWHFRKELWLFRAFDYSYNLKMFTRSLEITADFMESENTVSENAARNAKDIRKFINFLKIYAAPLEEAERLTGKDLTKLCESCIFDENEARNPELTELVTLADQIEASSWKRAWKLIARRGQYWWD